MAVIKILSLILVAHQVLAAPTTPDSHHCVFHGSVYKIGESFEDPDSCNTCFCDKFGVGCTEVWCPKDHREHNREVLNPSECHYGGHVYKAGEGFKSTDGCNTCGCSQNGMVMCTLMACFKPNLEGTLGKREVIGSGVCHYGGRVYKAGEGFRSTDGCNGCGCSEDGSVICTELACREPIRPIVAGTLGKRDVVIPGECHYGGHVYKAGEGFKSTDGCNSCGCSKGGFVYCTEMACFGPSIEGTLGKRDVLIPGECHYGGHVYKAGQGFNSTDGCNHCWCSENGFALCTKMACMPFTHLGTLGKRDVVIPGECHYGGHVYKAGEGFKSTDGCNSCGCSKGGFVFCTEMACLRPNVEGTLGKREVLNPGECHYGGHVYKAGEGFKSTDGCNSCGCSQNGFVMCTMRACLNINQ